MPKTNGRFYFEQKPFLFCLGSSRCNQHQKSFLLPSLDPGPIVRLSLSINFIYLHLNSTANSYSRRFDNFLIFQISVIAFRHICVIRLDPCVRALDLYGTAFSATPAIPLRMGEFRWCVRSIVRSRTHSYWVRHSN